ncbi:DUF6918 family protein [Nannocystaceae bacterium ST9]
MPSLPDLLLRPEIRPAVVDACVVVVEREVASKPGLGGVAIKAGFAVVSKVKPGFVREVVSNLLPDFASALDPMYREAASESGEASDSTIADAFVRRVERERSRAAEALLGVTDRKIHSARPSVQKAYERLRPTAREHVEAAMPNLVAELRPRLIR